MNRDSLEQLSARIFGSLSEPIERVWERASASVSPPIVWEGDAATFQFTFVSPNAERALGHPVRRWLEEPTFWSGAIIHPDDREDAVAYCALATAKKAHHTFEYRAVRADGEIVWLLDVVRVILGRRDLPERLRGLMFDITDEKRALGSVVRVGDLAATPTRAELRGPAG